MAGKLLNIGPKSLLWLRDIGITSRDDLERAGAVMAYRVLKDRNPRVSLNMLYALEAALTGRRWDALTEEEKARLRYEAEHAVEARILHRSEGEDHQLDGPRATR